MNIYLNIWTKIKELENQNEDAEYIRGLKDTYYMFRRYFSDSGIQNQHILEFELKRKKEEVENLLFKVKDLNGRLESARQMNVKKYGITEEERYTQIKSLESKIKKLEKENIELYRRIQEHL